MKFKVFKTLTLVSLTFAVLACGSAANTTSVTNANKTAVVTNAENTNDNSTTNLNANSNINSISSAIESSDGEVVKLDEAGIEMVAPKGFKIIKDGETVNMISPDNTLEVYFHIPADGNYEKAIDEITTEVDGYINDVVVNGKDENTDINGFPAFMTSGTGVNKDDGKSVGWDLTVLKAPRKPVLIVSYADEESTGKYEAEMLALVKSIRKI